MSTVDTSLVKKPYLKQSWTMSQLQDYARCLDDKDGPEYFLRNFYHIQSNGKQLFKPYPYQIDLIHNYHNNINSISLAGRQLGKTTVAGGYLLWTAMFVPHSLILVASNKYVGAQEIMQRIRFAYESCPDHIRCGAVSYNKGSIEFDNGSRIVSTTTTPTTGRGMSVTVLYADELAFVKPSIAKEFWASISPTLSTTGGKAIITSTPNTDEDLFAEIWHGATDTIDEFGNDVGIGRNGFSSYKATWDAHPDRDEAWKIREIGRVTLEKFEREHECKFVTAEETLINASFLLTMKPTDPVEKHGQVRWFQKPEKDKTYLVSLDPSLGTGGDYAAIQVYQLQGMIQVAEWMNNRTSVVNQVKLMKEIINDIFEITNQKSSVYFSLENNSIGEAALVTISEIGEEHFNGVFLSEVGKGRKGFTTTNKKKLLACSKFKHWVENGKMKINSKPLISQLKNYISNGSSYAAKPGETDDLVAASLTIVLMAQQASSYDMDAYFELREASSEFIEPMPFITF